MQRIFLVGVGLLAVCGVAQELSPREIFYGQGRPAAKTGAVKPKPARAPSLPPTASPVKSEEASRVNPPPVREEAQRVKAIAVAETIRPLGLKYTIVKRNENGEYTQVDPDSTFVNGDQIRLTIETNDSGYLYVVAQGTSRLWKPLFPNPEISGGDNHVERGKRYNIPSDSVFSFSGAPGTEKLFVVLSRRPEGDIRSLMYKLEDRQRDAAEPPSSMLAANIGIQDSMIQRLRTTYARDLVIEKVDENAKPERAKAAESQTGPPPGGERATYVVNPRAGSDAWVVADIQFHHQ